MTSRGRRSRSWTAGLPAASGLPPGPPRPRRRPPARPPARRQLTDGDGRHDERVPEEQRRRLGRQVAAEILKKQVLLGLLLGAAFRSHGGVEDRRPGAGKPRGHREPRVRPSRESACDPSAQRGGGTPQGTLLRDWPACPRYTSLEARLGTQTRLPHSLNHVIVQRRKEWRDL